MSAKKSDYMIPLSKPYTFEGKEYKELDMSPIEDLTTEQLKTAENMMARSGNFSIMNESSVAYTCFIASQVTGKPVEFFDKLPAKDGTKIKNIVMGFLNG